MRVCFFHLKAHAIFDSKSDAPIGGTLVQMHVIAQKLSESQEYEVSFLVGDYGQRAYEKKKGIEIFRSVELKRTIWNILKAPLLLWKDFGKVRADVFIGSSASPEIGLLALYCLLKKRTFIYRVAHEWDCTGEYVKKHGLLGRMFEWGLTHAQAIVVQSGEQHALLDERYGKKGVIIPNSYFLPESHVESQKEGVLWVSRCEKWKNPEAFLRLAEALPQYEFTLICPKQKYQEDLYERVSAQAQKIKNLLFLDFVPFDSIQAYFNRAKIFVGTSEYEGFPNTYMQACMGRTPVISLSVNPDDFIRKYDLGYVAQGDEKKLVEGVRTLLQNSEEWSKKADHALQYIHEYHDIQKNIQGWEGLFKTARVTSQTHR